jgi:hypothetical protein
MSYNTKYNIYFDDLYAGDSWTIHLKQDGYSGSEYTLAGGASPAVIDDPSNGENKFVPVKGTQMKMTVVPNLDSSDYDFKADFADIDDREWQAVLKKTVSSGIYTGSFEIDSLNISSNAVDPTGEIEITSVGDLVDRPTCDLKCDILVYPTSPASDTLYLYACPEYEGVDSPNAKQIAHVTINHDDTQDEWITRLAGNYAQITKIDSSNIRWEQQSYDADIDSGWQIKVKYKESEWKPYSATYYNFTGSTERQWIEVQWITEDDSDANEPTVTVLATHYFSSGETIADVVADIITQIDETTLENVYFSSLSGFVDELTLLCDDDSSGDGSTIVITLDGMGADGNGISIKSALTNDSYLRIIKRDGSDYAYNLTDFSGGDSGGDAFQVQVDEGSGFVTIGETVGYADDTAATIIERIVNDINNNYEKYDVAVDTTNSAKGNITIETSGAGSWVYKFITDGGSSVSPDDSSDGKAFNTSTKEQIKWIGWVVPGLYEQPHHGGNVKLQLKAVDGLGDLSSFPFEINDKRPFQKLRLLDIMSAALRKTDLNLRLFEAFDRWQVGTDITNSPLKEVYEDASRLNGVDCLTALKEVVRLAKGQIKQVDGRWEMIPLDQLHTGSITYRVFNYLGRYITTFDKTGFIKGVSSVTGTNVFLNRSISFEYEDAYKKVITKQNYGLVPQLLKFPNFDTINDNLNNELYPWAWMYDGERQASFLGKVNRTDNGYLRIAKKATDQTGVYYLRQQFTIGDVEQGEIDQKHFTFQLTYKQGASDSQAAADIQVKVYMTGGGATTYLTAETEATSLTTDDTTLTIDADEDDGDKTFELNFDYPYGLLNNVKEATGYIEIYQQTDGMVTIKSAKININAISTKSKNTTSYYSELVNELGAEILEIPIKLGDGPSVPNARQMYKNVLFWYDDDGTLRMTDAWDTEPDSSGGTPRPIVESMRHFYLQEYARPITFLSGKIHGDLEPTDVMRDETNSNLLMMMVAGAWDVKRSTIGGEWQEINIDDSAYTRVDKDEKLASTTGSDSYTAVQQTQEAGEEVDLSNYATHDDVNTAIRGNEGSFQGSDLTNYQITIYHSRNTYLPIVALYNENDELIDPSNFKIDTENSNTHFVLTFLSPLGSSEVAKFRVV